MAVLVERPDATPTPARTSGDDRLALGDLDDDVGPDRPFNPPSGSKASAGHATGSRWPAYELRQLTHIHRHSL